MEKSHRIVLFAVFAVFCTISAKAQSAFDRGMDAISKGDYKNAL